MTPASSGQLNLYGMVGDHFACAVIDYTGDRLIDFSDDLEFLNLFDSADLAADLNLDGLVDFADYLEFLNFFDACTDS